MPRLIERKELELKDFVCRDAVISIIASQTSADTQEKDNMEIMTTGEYYCKNGKFYIRYTETDDSGTVIMPTLVKVEDERRVTVTRGGSEFNNLELIRGERRHSVYNTGFGELLIGFSGTEISSTLGQKGGLLTLEYDLDINNAVTSHNCLKINVTAKS